MNARDALDRDAVIEFVLSCQHPNGGFGAHPDHDAHILYTLSAIQILVIEDAIDRIDAEKVAKYIASLQRDGGEIIGDEYGEVDTRFVYTGVQALAILGKLEEINVDAAADFIARCQNFDGGFGLVPGAESHSAQSKCARALNLSTRRHSGVVLTKAYNSFHMCCHVEDPWTDGHDR
jgi:geranylgeranyl transferase type-2 subunit beta